MLNNKTSSEWFGVGFTAPISGYWFKPGYSTFNPASAKAPEKVMKNGLNAWTPVINMGDTDWVSSL